MHLTVGLIDGMGVFSKKKKQRESERVENVIWNCGGITCSQSVLRYGRVLVEEEFFVIGVPVQVNFYS